MIGLNVIILLHSVASAINVKEFDISYCGKELICNESKNDMGQELYSTMIGVCLAWD